MKKCFCAFFCALTAVLSFFGLSACGKTDGEVCVYMPDGATALSMARLMTEDKSFGIDTQYRVVDGAAIQTYVTGKNPQADICVLPLNLASKLCGDGAVYKMLGAVTHGNLYILKKSGNDITVDNLGSLIGKTVGVVQLSQVPGLTFQIVLKHNNLQYNLLSAGNYVQTAVNLKAVGPAEVLPANTDCDYFIVPEPAATSKVNATGGKLSFAGSLQELYGGDNGYPQAVIVAKTALLKNNPQYISDFIAAVSDNAEWILSDGIQAYFNDIVGAINKNMPYGSVSSVNSSNLNKQVIQNCAIKFVKAESCKAEVNSFIQKLIQINPSAAFTVSEEFFYNG